MFIRCGVLKNLSGALAALVAALCPLAARAEWPEHPVTVVVPFGPGGANDLIARVAAAGLSKRLGQSVIVENKPGAGTIVGASHVARAKPDGYTFLVGAAGVITNSLLRAKMPYADSDLVPVGMIAVAPSVIVVSPSSPANNMKEFVALARSKGKEGMTFATAGSGSTPHFVSEMLKDATGAQFTIVPYKSGQDGVNAVLGNSVDATSEASIVVLPQIKAGKLKAIATTYEKRISAYPSLPTTAEQGFPSVNIGHWAGLFAPKGTPPAIIARVNAELQAAMNSKESIDRLVPNGIEPAAGSVASFADFIAAERDRLGKIAKKAGMTAD
jgi:tripartite-type tricarboxylate transporter receptor subunit TctC